MSIWHTLSMLLHLVALALWLGGIVFFLVVMRPAINEFDTDDAIRAINQGRISFEAISWTAIALLLVTGLTSLVLRYRGGAALGEFYWVALSLKLILFAAMALHHGLQVFKYGPRIASLTAKVPPDQQLWPEGLRAEWEKWFTLLKINATLGPVVTLMGLMLMRY
jgi:putative copper resistance protein D